jgi:hypothetical protein
LFWTLAPIAIGSFVDDRDIHLPRFQRKLTWSDKQRFDLTLSLFNDFPMGNVVVKIDDSVSPVRKYLLDGRQRRAALRDMRDPDLVYQWARAALRARATTGESELIQLYYARIVDYFGEEAWQELDSGYGDGDGSPSPEIESTAIEVDEDMSVDPPLPNALKELLELILVVHKGGSAGFAKPFQLDDAPSKLPYRDDSGAITSASIRKWLRERWEASEDEGEPYPPSQSTFLGWVTPAGLAPTETDVLALNVSARWDWLTRSMGLARTLESRVSNGRLGVLEIRNTTHSAERKIFEIINAAGTPLTAVEILSAKHTWNESVAPVSQAASQNVAELYSTMGLPKPVDIVRWDLAATVMDRLPIPYIFGDLGGTAGQHASGPRTFERRVTLGFRSTRTQSIGFRSRSCRHPCRGGRSRWNVKWWRPQPRLSSRQDSESGTTGVCPWRRPSVMPSRSTSFS